MVNHVTRMEILCRAVLVLEMEMEIKVEMEVVTDRATATATTLTRKTTIVIGTESLTALGMGKEEIPMVTPMMM